MTASYKQKSLHHTIQHWLVWLIKKPEIYWDLFYSVVQEKILVQSWGTELGHTMVHRFSPVSVEGVCIFSPCLCETETVVKLWPTQSRCH